MQQRLPNITRLDRFPKNRRRLVYFDHRRNTRGQTLAAAYCLRPTPGATVSTPLLRGEMKKGLDPSVFTYETLARRLDRYGDLWEPVINPPSARCTKLSRDRP